jgi:acetyl-CoA C-acetyltransferase/acetyl-CoA acyltransferase
LKPLRKKIYAGAGFTTVFMGSGRNEFDPSKAQRTFDSYLKETADGTLAYGIDPNLIDMGVIGSFMAARFLNQGNLPGFLPFMIPSLRYKPCFAVEGACGTGGRAIGVGALGLLADQADVAFIAGFEIQNAVKAVYGADILAGAGFYDKERKSGHAYFFPGVFSERAGAYYEKYGYDKTRQGMAAWYEQAIENARKNPKAQEYHNTNPDLLKRGSGQPDPKKFVPHLIGADCSKVSDGASSLLLFSEEGLNKAKIDKSNVIEIVAIAHVEDNIAEAPADLTVLKTTEIAVKEALHDAGISISEIGWLELHDCFTITAILTLEAIGFAPKGEGASFIKEGHTKAKGIIPTNLSGGLCGFGHPTGASGVRMLVDLHAQMTGKASNQVDTGKKYGMMISMGGNDKTVTVIVAKIP